MKRMLLPLLILTLSGCKTELKTVINVSQLNKDIPDVVGAQLDVEVASCNSFEDSRVESRSLLDAKQAISTIIPKAQYTQCYQKRMNSFASFNIPVIVGKLSNDTTLDSSSFYVFSVNQTGQALMVGLPLEMKQRINNYKKKRLMSTLNNFNIEIVLKNDTNETFFYDPIAAYIDNSPIVTSYGDGISLNKGKSVVIRLSDVSTANALHEKISLTPVLLTVKKDK